MTAVTSLYHLIEKACEAKNLSCSCALNEVTVVLSPESLIEVATWLRDDKSLAFNMLIDVTAVDYLHYGLAEWQTEEKTGSGYSRGVETGSKLNKLANTMPTRFAVIHHLMSIQQNWRIRLKTYVADDSLRLPSVIELWPAANWFEREVFDLFGIVFEGHPDLRRILTDYGFIGHPFRKDFPVSGHVEMRYDAASERVVYEKVDLEPRVLVPKVIRKENDYGRQRKESKLEGESA